MTEDKSLESFLVEETTQNLVEARCITRFQKEIAPQMSKIIVQEWMKVLAEEIDRRRFVKERAKE